MNRHAGLNLSSATVPRLTSQWDSSGTQFSSELGDSNSSSSRSSAANSSSVEEQVEGLPVMLETTTYGWFLEQGGARDAWVVATEVAVHRARKFTGSMTTVIDTVPKCDLADLCLTNASNSSLFRLWLEVPTYSPLSGHWA